MKIAEKEYDVAAIVGRFQVPKLHAGHYEIIQSVSEKHGPPIIILGLAPILGSITDPLPFEPRKRMIEAEFPDARIYYIKDCASDDVWDARLDALITDIIKPGQEIVLYGGRDSFVDKYKGKFDTRELVTSHWISGTEIRKLVGNRPRNTEDWRAGVCWGTSNKFPACLATVDVAVFNEDETKILLARKHDETLFRFIGGFSDPRSASYEADARREVHEEAGIEITDPVYVGSTIINDWRYRPPSVDKIKTLLFKAKHMYGRPEGADDVAAVAWFDVDKLNKNQIVETHWPLLDMLLGGKVNA